ncbi:molybdopterin-synthase adenylyltransferase MoeB [Pseudomonas proteolytica]|jgi:molybdopterin/thiamine biosynthesis adenylyltransferase/rhodanese-related sulfurtransferase|uniref:molybdopterin-synthase adenylyltransferase MoeB n=1 Tax=Pseudomonas TaxID=286 RepID=UPI0008DA4E6E|nr:MULTISPECIES: molybdopterin-synthase adenylyltransferase MoeB [Pseudomonas]VVN74819.1 putative adenylyltransferase/sulfurtransferase MoeZ [Pseudomonas fluorescens]MBC3335450.1 molybdopterin-synthase adenylyltransferase MoeB [Pseudomonas proteolytica]NMZ01418.1 molybdopterin-synthase adenylyltransferase MoeB [Pseudomonas proteolytica]NMZ10086.1 molybdopterin-synthase adenylyltransferase MoeB [Pseudomonas proteolytica]OHW38669.1 adenylyltransferase/sulfurtransferase MoeZ [Pseudomonas sp. 06C 
MQLPPLVEAGATLSASEISRYSRHLLLPEIGLEGQQRLKHSRVLVIGAGGLGSPTLLYLAAAGVGTLGIIDFDVVDDSNLQRQVIHRLAEIGQLKTQSAKRTLQALNPHIQINLHNERLDNDNAVALFSNYDLMLDGTDNFATRYLVNDACVLARKPYVWGSIYRFEGQASVFWEQAPSGGINYRDLYPEPPPAHLAPSCSEGGVLGVLCASIGAIMATEAIKLITGIGNSLLGRLAVYDALEMSYRFLPLRPAPQRQPITALLDYQHLCGLGSTAPPASVPSLDAHALQALRLSKQPLQLIDVREKNEWDILHIPQAQLIPMQQMLSGAHTAQLSPDAEIVVYCKAGSRSRTVVQALAEQGLRNVRSLEGGVLAWAAAYAPTLPAY